MSLKSDRREWDDLARRDALWAVVSNREIGTWPADEFLASGEAEVERVFADLAARSLSPRRGRALDFGCGVGRLSQALASRFERVVGVDLSEAMLAQARSLGPPENCSYRLNDGPDLAPLRDDDFDFVLSLIALQHVSDPAALRAYVREFVRVAAPGAVIVFQLPSAIGWQVRWHPLRALNRVLRRLPWAPGGVLRALMPYAMELAALPEPEVRAILERAGARVEAVVDDARTGSDALPSRCYLARVPAVA